MKTFHSTSTTTLLLLALVALRASGQPVPPSSPEVRADNASPRDALNTVRPSTLLTSEVIRGGVGPVRGPTWPAEGYEEVLPAGHGMILPRSSDSTRALVEGRGNNVDPFSRRSVISVLMKNKKLALGGAALVGLLQSVLRRDDADEHLVHAPAAALLHSRDLAAAPAPAPAAQPASADTVSPGSLVFIAAPDAWSTKMGSASRAVVAGERTSFPAMTPLPSGARLRPRPRLRPRSSPSALATLPLKAPRRAGDDQSPASGRAGPGNDAGLPLAPPPPPPPLARRHEEEATLPVQRNRGSPPLLLRLLAESQVVGGGRSGSTTTGRSSLQAGGARSRSRGGGRHQTLPHQRQHEEGGPQVSLVEGAAGNQQQQKQKGVAKRGAMMDVVNGGMMAFSVGAVAGKAIKHIFHLH